MFKSDELISKRILIIFVVLTSGIVFSSVNAQTSAVINNVSGVSKFDNTTTNYKIYGGVAGTCPAGSLLATSTCNSCIDTTGGLKPCNRVSIHANLDINLTYTSASALSSPTTLTLRIGSGTTNETTLDTETSTGVKTYTFTTKWGDICNAISSSGAAAPAGLNSDCSLTGVTDVSSTDFELRVYEGSTEVASAAVVFHGIPSGVTNSTIDYVSATNGISQYDFFPGDEKLILQGYTGPASMPSGTPELDAVVFFLDVHTPQADGSIAAVTTNTYGNGKGPTADFTWTSTTSTLGTTAYIEGLENGVTYCVIAGHMNKAQNIFLFSNTGFDTSRVCKSPNIVVGALEDTRCFISTAAFGSPWASEVIALRKFRDQVLLQSNLGQKFVELYYQLSPPVAKFIQKNEFLKSIVRLALTPAVWFSEWSTRDIQD